jgi:hypothetical protein
MLEIRRNNGTISYIDDNTYLDMIHKLKAKTGITNATILNKLIQEKLQVFQGTTMRHFIKVKEL